MKYLLDTNVISELVKTCLASQVKAWFTAIPSDSLYLSVLTLGEIRKGADKMIDQAKKEKIRIWLEHELPLWFNNRILPIDLEIANKWGILQSKSKNALAAIDSLIAATELHHDLALVTRNVKDFTYQGLQVINPWEI